MLERARSRSLGHGHYEALRRPAAAEVLALSQRLTKLATVQGAFARRLRNVGLALLGWLPFVRRRVALGLSGLSRAKLAEVPAPGAPPRLPPAAPRLPRASVSHRIPSSAVPESRGA